MIYYANPSGPVARDAMDRGELGCIVSPNQGNRPAAGWDLIADNGAFAGRWDHDRWLTWLDKLPRDDVRFAVAPDVVADHDATLARWATYAPLIASLGFVPAFACQDGATPATVPQDAAVLFIGGSTEWKLGPRVWDIAVAAHLRGVWLHLARVNSRRRFNTARTLRASSVDGTFITFAPRLRTPELLGWIAAANAAPMLWETPT